MHRTRPKDKSRDPQRELFASKCNKLLQAHFGHVPSAEHILYTLITSSDTGGLTPVQYLEEKGETFLQRVLPIQPKPESPQRHPIRRSTPPPSGASATPSGVDATQKALAPEKGALRKK